MVTEWSQNGLQDRTGFFMSGLPFENIFNLIIKKKQLFLFNRHKENCSQGRNVFEFLIKLLLNETLDDKRAN